MMFVIDFPLTNHLHVFMPNSELILLIELLVAVVSQENHVHHL